MRYFFIEFCVLKKIGIYYSYIWIFTSYMHSYNISHLSYTDATEMLTAALCDANNISCQIDFDADHSRSKIIRDFVGHIFDMHSIHHPWRGRFILITDELINNAIEHGSTKWDIDSCIIEAGTNEKSEFYISLEVHDTGSGKDAKDATHMEDIRINRLGNPDEWVYMNKRGRWLFHITEKLVDKLSFSLSPKWWLAVKIEKSIPKILNE